MGPTALYSSRKKDLNDPLGVIFIITIHMSTVVYFWFSHFPIPAALNTQSQVCLNPQLKVVPDKCTFYSSLSNITFEGVLEIAKETTYL